MREPEPRAERGRETEIESFLWQEERGCGSRSNAGLLKKDMIRIERENVGEAEKRTGTEAFFCFFSLCGYVNVLPVLLKFALLLNANFSINPFHANF